MRTVHALAVNSTYLPRIEGIAPYTSSGLELGVQDFLVINVTLEVGGVEESIIVTGDWPPTYAPPQTVATSLRWRVPSLCLASTDL